MKIPLDEKYFLKDGYGATFVLVEIQRATDKTAKEQLRELSIAYGDLDALIRRYIRQVIQDNNVDKVIELKDYIKEYKRLAEDVTSKLKGDI